MAFPPVLFPVRVFQMPPSRLLSTLKPIISLRIPQISSSSLRPPTRLDIASPASGLMLLNAWKKSFKKSASPPPPLNSLIRSRIGIASSRTVSPSEKDLSRSPISIGIAEKDSNRSAIARTLSAPIKPITSKSFLSPSSASSANKVIPSPAFLRASLTLSPISLRVCMESTIFSTASAKTHAAAAMTRRPPPMAAIPSPRDTNPAPPKCPITANIPMAVIRPPSAKAALGSDDQSTSLNIRIA